MLPPDKKMMLEKLISGEHEANVSPVTKPMPGDSKDAMLQAKIAALMQMLQELEMEMSGRVKGDMDEMSKMKQVTVAAPDQEGLEDGLEMAKEVTEELPGKVEDNMDADEVPADEEEEDEGQHGLFGRKRK